MVLIVFFPLLFPDLLPMFLSFPRGCPLVWTRGPVILATLTLAILNQVADEEMDIVDLESVDLIYYSNPCLIPGEFGLTRKLG